MEANQWLTAVPSSGPRRPGTPRPAATASRPGCDNCYALTLAKRLKAMGAAKYQTRRRSPHLRPGLRRSPFTRDALRRAATVAQSAAHGVRELHVRPVPRPGPARLRRAGLRRHGRHPAAHLPGADQAAPRLRQVADQLDWPANVWMGVSVENARNLPRVDDLRQVPAAVRFLSCEPLLGPLDGLRPDRHRLGDRRWRVRAGTADGPGLGHRDPRPVPGGDVAFFFKQWGGRTPKAGGRTSTAGPGTRCPAVSWCFRSARTLHLLRLPGRRSAPCIPPAKRYAHGPGRRWNANPCRARLSRTWRRCLSM